MTEFTLHLELIAPHPVEEKGHKGYLVYLGDEEEYLLTYRLVEFGGQPFPLVIAVCQKTEDGWQELNDTQVQNELGVTLRRGEIIIYPARVVFQILSFALERFGDLDEDDSGGSGVREPLGPRPVSPSAAATVTPDEVAERRSGGGKSAATE